MGSSASLTRIQVDRILKKVVHITLNLNVLVLPLGLQLLASLQTGSDVVREELRLEGINDLRSMLDL